MIRRLLALGIAAGFALGVAACASEGTPPALRAGNCWGTGATDCQTAMAARGALLGLGNRDFAAPAACGAVIDCATTPTPAATRTPAAARTEPTPSTAAATATSDGSTPAERVAVVEPIREATPAAASSGGDPCGTIAVLSLESKASLSPAETVCLQATADGRRSAPDPEIQVAAVTLFNTRAGGWPAAVEAALKRPALKNAPALSFAGIKPAYDQGRYGTVLTRTRNVWRNLDKGYQLGAKDKTFVTEFACRSAGQLALSGNPPDDGLDWCERWLDRASRAGQPTGPINDLISQVE